MDMMMVDVTQLPGARVGEEVVFIGQQGADRITATEVSDAVGTIPYEAVCAISSRVPRVYQ
jgi:alanine racemase